MHRIRSLAVLIAVCASLAGTSSAQAGSTQERVARLVNKARVTHGIRPVRVSSKLTRSSRRYARKILRSDVLAHSRHIGGGFRRTGEVIAIQSSRRPRPRRIVRMWMSSPSHRAVLLSNGFGRLGVARAYGRLGGPRRSVWVGQLGGG